MASTLLRSIIFHRDRHNSAQDCNSIDRIPCDATALNVLCALAKPDLWAGNDDVMSMARSRLVHSRSDVAAEFASWIYKWRAITPFVKFDFKRPWHVLTTHGPFKPLVQVI